MQHTRQLSTQALLNLRIYGGESVRDHLVMSFWSELRRVEGYEAEEPSRATVEPVEGGVVVCLEVGERG